MLKELSAGGVVYSVHEGHPCILLILDVYGRWTLPKGHIENGETPQVAALREIEEEVGLTGNIESDLGETQYQYTRDSQVIDKVVYYYLVHAAGPKLRLAPAEVRDAQWFPLDRVLHASDYSNNQHVLEKAVDLLRTKPR